MEKSRILLVDDEVTITRSLSLYLEATGAYQVRTENHGSQAVSAAREFQPDLVLLDIIMPDQDGASIAGDLQADPNLKDIPIVFLTAIVSRKEVGAQGRDIGGHPFLAKPLDPDQVVACIERNLEYYQKSSSLWS